MRSDLEGQLETTIEALNIVLNAIASALIENLPYSELALKTDDLLHEN